ncbi:RNA polymerase sigma factor [Roseivirga sp. E12]|uniref:RNA polymerase sigma factor n=1 Tax=Roseivirga sp. E12 TaxID=2819237 RepID=UPI001ABCA578|nr:sigma-70 family RNA polymerase sigma factor [Roseivirga sp. E12]MBO3697475.1 sigma-70 family RNA polymerase sigma factor [Roseivirga sp. E12]
MDDQSLVKSVLGGNQQAFEFLIRKYEKLVFHMIHKLTREEVMVEELAQDVFMKVYEKLPGFRFDSKLSTWIGTIAYRHTINVLKKTSKMTYKSLEEANEEQFFKEKTTPADILEASSVSQFVQKNIDKLPAHYRNVLYLYHIEEMSYPEIVEITGMPEGTVKNYLFRARKLLKEELSKYMQKEELL